MTSTTVFLVQSLVVVSLPYAVWRYGGMRHVVPIVVVQILVGILAGPSVLGAVAPDIWSLLFTHQTLMVLKGLAWLAVVVFAFLTGLHLKPAGMQVKGLTFTLVSLSSLVTPLLMGLAAGLWIAQIYPDSMGPKANLWQFAAGFSLCTSVTALPVLGAILRETGLLRHRTGRFALGIAAMSDATLWFLLGLLLLNISNPAGSMEPLFWMPVATAAYVIIMLLLVRPLRQLFRPGEPLDDKGLVLVCTLIFSSALIAESIGLHATLGGFLAGAIMPRHATSSIVDRLEPVTVAVLLPFFFTLTGISTHFDIGTSSLMMIAAVAILVSMAGKIAGTALPAYAMGESWSDAFSLGVLVQTKGMMEVVVLTVLLEAGTLSPTTFSALLVMTIVSTA
ncbi:MAG: cation:proton antiporter, partial [Magnetococcales bacterium]|nr:cation:proton antiporter [Magnetococcales bacterium]